MSYVIAAIAGGVLLTIVLGDQMDKTATFTTGAIVGFAVQLTLRGTGVS